MIEIWRDEAASEGTAVSSGGPMTVAVSRVVRKILGVTEIDPKATAPFSIAIIALDSPGQLMAERGKKGVDLCVWSIIENLTEVGFLPENMAFLSDTQVVAVMPNGDWDFTEGRIDQALTRHDGYARTMNSGKQWHASAGIASYPRDETRVFELSRWAERALSMARFMGSDASFSWGDPEADSDDGARHAS